MNGSVINFSKHRIFSTSLPFYLYWSDSSTHSDERTSVLGRWADRLWVFSLFCVRADGRMRAGGVWTGFCLVQALDRILLGIVERNRDVCRLTESFRLFVLL